MANADGKHEYPWIEKIKSEGAVPLLDPNNCTNGWASPPGDAFRVRGPGYFSTKTKVPAGEYLLKPLGFDWVKCSTKVSELLKNPSHRIRRALQDEVSIGNSPFIWAFNLQVPSKENYSAVAYFISMDPAPAGSLMEKFLKGDDTLKNSRLKLIGNIVKGPWIVKKAVGEQAICIIGRALTCKYCQGEDFMEVDIDIGSSMVANAIVHLAFGYITSLTVDLAFLIESQNESELPEQILGGVRFSELKTESARAVELHSEGSSTGRRLQSSLSMRLLKSIGQGFTSLLHQGPHDNDSNSNNINSSISHSNNGISDSQPTEEL